MDAVILSLPLGMALWAYVSDEVNKELEFQQQANLPFRLVSHDWKSGEIPWLLAVLAPKEVAQALVKKLEDTLFKDKTYKQFTLRPMGVEPQSLATDNEERQARPKRQNLQPEQCLGGIPAGMRGVKGQNTFQEGAFRNEKSDDGGCIGFGRKRKCPCQWVGFHFFVGSKNDRGNRGGWEDGCGF